MMVSGIELRLLGILVLIFLSGFFSGAETNFFNLLGRGALQEVEKNNPALAKKIRSLLSRPGQLISSILIGNEIVNILISILVASILIQVFADRANLKGEVGLSILSILVSTSLILVFGEVIPKTIGIRFSLQLAPYVAPPMFLFSKIIMPLRLVLVRLSEGIIRVFGISRITEHSIINPEEIRELVEMGGDEGVLDQTEYALLKNIFEFGDLTAAEVLTPREEVFSLPLGMEYRELKEKMLKSGYSRVPIYLDSPDQIVGILTVKDLIKLEQDKEKNSLEKVLHKPFFVPPQKKLNELLRDFLYHRGHLALVVNEYGGVIGLVSLENLLEVIFGEGGEESEERELVELGENRWEALGRMALEDFNQDIQAHFHFPGAKTLAGYLLNEFGRVPEPGEELVRSGYRFRIKEMRKRQIYKIEVERIS